MRSAAIGKPTRLSLGSVPVATSVMPTTAAQTYRKAPRIRSRRRYLGSRSARSTRRNSRHIDHARAAENASTPTMLVAIIPGDSTADVTLMSGILKQVRPSLLHVAGVTSPLHSTLLRTIYEIGLKLERDWCRPARCCGQQLAQT